MPCFRCDPSICVGKKLKVEEMADMLCSRCKKSVRKNLLKQIVGKVLDGQKFSLKSKLMEYLIVFQEPYLEMWAYSKKNGFWIMCFKSSSLDRFVKLLESYSIIKNRRELYNFIKKIFIKKWDKVKEQLNLYHKLGGKYFKKERLVAEL